MTRTTTVAGYAVLVGLLITCEAIGRKTGRVATFARTTDTLARFGPLWFLVLAGWLWLGWHLFTRVGR